MSRGHSKGDEEIMRYNRRKIKMGSLRTITKLKRQVKVLRKQNAELRLQLKVQLMEQLRSLQEKVGEARLSGAFPDCESDDMTVDQDGVPVDVDRGRMFLVDMEEQRRRHFVDDRRLGRYTEEGEGPSNYGARIIRIDTEEAGVKQLGRDIKVNSIDGEFEISQPIAMDVKVFENLAKIARKIELDIKGRK